MCFSFVWFHVATETALRYVFHLIFRDLVFADEKDGVGCFHSSADSLDESSKFIGCWCVPYLFMFGISIKLPIIEVLSCFVIAYELYMFALLMLMELHVVPVW